MSAVELAIEKVKCLDETQARRLIEWLGTIETRSSQAMPVLGAHAMLGYARRFRQRPRSTAEWMAELRDGEKG